MGFSVNRKAETMTLLSKIKTLAVGKAITLTRVRVELRPNGLIHIFDYSTKMWATVNTEGKQIGGSLPLTPSQIRSLTGSQV